MAIPSFYYKDLALLDKTIELDPHESSHAISSRRLKSGHAVRIFNGEGLVALGVLGAATRKRVSVEINSVDQHKRPNRLLSVAVALPKGDRQKVMIDMLTQLGVFEIIPLRCDRSITKFRDSSRDKWERVAVEACKQSQNPWLPVISEEVVIGELLNDRDRNLMYAGIDTSLSTDIAEKFDELTVLVGPEGGFSENEFAKLHQFSVPSLSVGRYILRTEVAAVAVVSSLLD